MRLDGKVALISGSASGITGSIMGFGGAIAWLFAKEGAKVIITDIQDDLGNQTAIQMQNTGHDVYYQHLDVLEESDWITAMDKMKSAYGKLDILVNNAGAGVRTDLLETTEEIWDSQIDVHVKGVFLGTKHAVPEMRRIGGGSIINISSIYGIIGSPTSAPYSAAKGASRILTKASAIQYAKDNIRINSVHPGFAETPMTKDNLSDLKVRGSLLSRIPLGRLGNATDIAHAALYLACDESKYVTGSELVIDGGTTAQ